VNLQTAIAHVTAGKILAREQAQAVMEELVSGQASEENIKTFLLELNKRPYQRDELTGFAQGLRAKALKVNIQRQPVVDTCGTGGDGLHTVNISTAAAFVVAGAGVAVAKHGNRSVSSKCGSTDVLEELGVPVDLPAEETVARVEKAGFGFFFAPRFHPAMKHVGPVRKALGVRTIFNLLGPMVNPAGVKRQVVGVYDPDLLETYAHVLLDLGAERVLVVRGEDGMDEISPAAPTRVCLGENGQVRSFTVTPEDLGLPRRDLEEIRGGDARTNAAAIRGALSDSHPAVHDAICLNAAAALVAAGTTDDLSAALLAAAGAIKNGNARKALAEAAA
jgi:anthranilate phosphoribosyltransferase